MRNVSGHLLGWHILRLGLCRPEVILNLSRVKVKINGIQWYHEGINLFCINNTYLARIWNVFWGQVRKHLKPFPWLPAHVNKANSASLCMLTQKWVPLCLMKFTPSLYYTIAAQWRMLISVGLTPRQGCTRLWPHPPEAQWNWFFSKHTEDHAEKFNTSFFCCWVLKFW